jgi:hypothetical protein
MNIKTTRTLNPLPFQDLETRRFEDLVRQLAYDFRAWKLLEPTGRGGSDDGMDIRGIEQVDTERSDDPEDEDEPGVPVRDERLWVFQCKREKSIGPKELRKYVAESVPDKASAPYGLVLAAACDFSKKARDAFRAEVVTRGVKEFYLWGKADLEDMLFQPKNDPLLFAYFGLSLQPRRRTLRTHLRSLIATKKQVRSVFKESYENRNTHQTFVIRDPNNDTYPKPHQEGERPGWLLYRIQGEDVELGAVVIWHEHPAWVSSDGKQWDAIESADFALMHARSDIRSARNRFDNEDNDPTLEAGRGFWNEYVGDSQRATLKVVRVVPWDRILAIDPHGDESHPVPHLFVEFDQETGPFNELEYAWLVPSWYDGGGRPMPRASRVTRATFFPVPIPENLYPPPRTVVDEPLQKPPRLSKEVAAQLDAALAAFKPKKPAEDSVPPPIAPGKTEASLAFQAWIDRVARPAFSAVITKLNLAGHQAWIVPRIKDDRTRSLIELQLRLRSPSTHNPDYHRTGELVYALNHDGEISVQVRPTKDEPYSRKALGVRAIDTFTLEQVEMDIVAIITALGGQTYP